jgi:hypothetical protein
MNAIYIQNIVDLQTIINIKFRMLNTAVLEDKYILVKKSYNKNNFRNKKHPKQKKKC